ncbi:MAG: hypothetical protein KatS3mg082_2433 [Nitrospiraceae bacterium]|nr:MAG: hypothetical protein KatS3mg082_2433 [Nitrospiraceae bacterium]
MFVGCGVIHNLRRPYFKNCVDTIFVEDRTEQRHDFDTIISLQPATRQILNDVVESIFADIQEDETTRALMQNLPAQLAANRTAGARNQNNAVHNIVTKKCRVGLRRLPSEQINDIWLPDVLICDFPASELLKARQESNSDGMLQKIIQLQGNDLPVC